MPFTRASKMTKYLEINLTKEVKDLHSKNYKMLMTEIEDTANGKISCVPGLEELM